jgi:hypothetical protein
MITNVSICIELNACNLTHLKYLIEDMKKCKKKDLDNILFRVEMIQDELREMEKRISDGV